MGLIASLPMYDWPELKKSNNEFWEYIRDYLKGVGIPAPDALLRNSSGDNDWLSPDLLLGQTCGFPFANLLTEKVQYVATPVYAVEGCEGPQYSSVIVANIDSGTTIDNFTAKKLAYNSTNSWSGYQVIVKEIDFSESHLDNSVLSGEHRNSAQLVARGKAEVAAIDAICWHYLKKFDPEIAKNLKVITWTNKYPALPFISSLDTPFEVIVELQKCLRNISSKLEDGGNSNQVFAGCEVLGPGSYDVFIKT